MESLVLDVAGKMTLILGAFLRNLMTDLAHWLFLVGFTSVSSHGVRDNQVQDLHLTLRKGKKKKNVESISQKG